MGKFTLRLLVSSVDPLSLLLFLEKFHCRSRNVICWPLRGFWMRCDSAYAYCLRPWTSMFSLNCSQSLRIKIGIISIIFNCIKIVIPNPNKDVSIKQVENLVLSLLPIIYLIWWLGHRICTVVWKSWFHWIEKVECLENLPVIVKYILYAHGQRWCSGTTCTDIYCSL